MLEVCLMCFAVYCAEMELFEETLKATLVHISFNRSAKYRTNWYRQVKEIDCYWDQMVSDIQEQDVIEIFLWACRKKKLDFDHLNFKLQMQKATTERRIELMTRVANKIYQFFHDEVDGDFVKWNGQSIVLI